MSRRYAFAFVCAGVTTSAACSFVANLGDTRVLDPGAPDTGPDAPDAADAPDAEIDVGPEVDAAPIEPMGSSVETTGLLQLKTGASCTAVLVGPSTILTAASCFPRHAHGCESAFDAIASSSFTLGTEVRQLDGLAVAPLAFAPLTSCTPSCDPVKAADVRASVRRSHDVALLHLSTPIATRVPLRVLTRLDDPTPLAGRRTFHAFFDVERLGNLGAASVSTTRWTELAPTKEASALVATDPLHGCEQVPSSPCTAVDVRYKCPDSAIGSGGAALGLYDDQLVRLIGFEAFAPGAALARARGTPVVVEGASFPVRPALPAGEAAIGIVVDALDVSGGSVTLVAPTFGEEVGAFLDARLEDFDGDCLADDVDAQPTVPQASGCKAAATPWSNADVSATKPISTATAPLLGLAPVITSRGVGLLDLYARVLDHSTHHIVCGTSSCLGSWEPLEGQLLGGIAASSIAPDHQLLLGSAPDTTLDQRTFDGAASWSAWTKTSVDAVVGGAAIVSIDKATAEAWYRRGQSLWRSRWSKSGGWLAAEDAGVLVSSDPCAVFVADGGGRIDVLARGTEKQRFGLVRLTLAPSAPLSAVSPTLVPTTLASAPSCAAADATRIDVFVRGTRSILQHAILRAGQSKLVFEDLGPITSKPSATTWGQGRWDVVARGLHGEIEHWWLQE